MPEHTIWSGSPSQVKNAWPFFFAGVAALAIRQFVPTGENKWSVQKTATTIAVSVAVWSK